MVSPGSRPRLSRGPTRGDVHIFLHHRRNLTNLLLWDRTTFWLLARHLEQGTLQLPVNLESQSSPELR